MQSPSRWVAALFGLAAVKFLILLLAADDYLIAHTLSDDSFYYLQIAKNAWYAGIFPSFDGINLTNGFHFLYQLILIPLTPLFNGELITTYRFVITLNAIFFLGGAAVLWQVLKTHFAIENALTCIAFLLLANLPFKIVNTGLEASLAFLLSSAFLWALFCLRAKPWQLGIILGLLILARLDIGAFHALFFGLWILWRQSKTKDWSPLREGVTVAMVASLFYLPVLIFNITTFGRIGSISQNTKMFATFSQATDTDGHFLVPEYLTQLVKATTTYAKQIGGNTVGDAVTYPYVLIAGQAPSMNNVGEVFRFLFSHGFAWTLILTAMAGVAFLLERQLPKSSKTANSGVLLLFLILLPIAHFFTVVFLLSWHGGIWYWLPITLGIAVAGISIGHGAIRTAFLFLAITGFLYIPTLLLQSGAFSRDYKEISWYTGPIDVANYAKKRLPEDATIGCFNAGLFGYVAPTTVVNLDGLVNNWELLEARKNGQVREYVLRQKIGYLCDFGPWDKYLSEVGFDKREVRLLYDSPSSNGYLLRLKPVSQR